LSVKLSCSTFSRTFLSVSDFNLSASARLRSFSHSVAQPGKDNQQSETSHGRRLYTSWVAKGQKNQVTEEMPHTLTPYITENKEQHELSPRELLNGLF
jgi:hypothetical protein